MSQPVVKFIKESHTYIKGDRLCVSANKIKDYFKPKFDGDYWGKYKALEDCIPNFKDLKKLKWKKYPHSMKPPVEWLDELINTIPEEWYIASRNKIRLDWEGSAQKGTVFHDEREQEAYDKGYRINPWDNKPYTVDKYKKEYDNESVVTDLSKLKDGCYPELVVWYDIGDITVTGQLDDPYIETSGERYVDIHDYKNFKKFRKGKSSETYNAPFKHLDTSKTTNTAVQLSIYAYIMEVNGYKVRNLGFSRYQNYDYSTGELYDLPYYRDEVKEMIEIYSKKYSLQQLDNQ